MTKRIIALQTGARRNYAVPSILQQAGMLEAFYTDLCASAGLGALLDRVTPQSLRRGAMGRMLNRKVPPNLAGKIETFDWPTISFLMRRQVAGDDLWEQYQALAKFHEDFSRAMIGKELGHATHVFSMHSEGSGFLKFARGQGLRIVVEVYTSPSRNRIIQAEKQKFSDIESPLPAQIVEADHATFREVCDVADVFIAPSSFVEKGLIEFGVDKDRCRAVPYAVGDSWFKIESNPTRGRILFVGAAVLGKGIHILGQAAQKLCGRHYEFRVAGNVTDKIRAHETTRELDFLGRVARLEIQREYAGADIFVLPSLAEGSAEVTYEALAAGVPVITTEATGSVIRDGIEGFIVPERDAETLAARIEELVENRELRHRMAAAARERAKEYTWDKYAERLVAVFQAV